jgi:hypothetical protein
LPMMISGAAYESLPHRVVRIGSEGSTSFARPKSESLIAGRFGRGREDLG